MSGTSCCAAGSPWTRRPPSRWRAAKGCACKGCSTATAARPTTALGAASPVSLPPPPPPHTQPPQPRASLPKESYMNFKETNAFPECDQAFTSASTRGSRSSLVTALCPSRPSKTTRTGRSTTSPHPRVLLCSGTPTCRATLSTLARLAYCASERLRLDCVWAGTATLCTRARSLGSVSRSRCGPLSSGTGPLIAPQVPATPSAPSVRTPSPLSCSSLSGLRTCLLQVVSLRTSRRSLRRPTRRSVCGAS